MFLSVFNVSAGTATDAKIAWIETSMVAGRLHVQAYVKSPKLATLHYDLISEKTGNSGSSKTKQAGKINAEVGETYPLTKLQLGIASEDKYTLTLNVYENGELVAKDAVIYPND